MSNFHQLVSELASGNPDCMGALLLHDGGQIEAGHGASEELVTSAVAMALPLRELLDRSTAEMGGGAFSSAVVEGSNSSFALADVDGVRMTIVIGAPGAAQGALLADARFLAERCRAGGSA